MADVAETVRLVDETPLDGLKDLDIEDVYVQMDAVLRERPGPAELFRRWERQQWSASALDFRVDRHHWDQVFLPFIKDQLTYAFCGFFVGEQAVTDTLSPLLMGAPDEETRWFLSTQVVDEARHAYFFSRFFGEVLGVNGSVADTIAYAKAWTDTAAYRSIFDRDLVEITDAVRLDPTDYAKWVKGIALYHIMVEGVLALVGQKFLLRILRNLDLLPAFRAGFTAVTRDESRHVNFGVWALGQAVARGHEADIREVVDLTLEGCFRIYANPERRIEIPEDVPDTVRQDPRTNWAFGVESLTKRLRVAGVEAGYLKGVGERAWKICWDAIDEYESRHGVEHPVRSWERGERVAAGA